MELELNSDMGIIELGAGLVLVANLSWLAAFIALLLIVAQIERTMPGSLTLRARYV